MNAPTLRAAAALSLCLALSACQSQRAVTNASPIAEARTATEAQRAFVEVSGTQFQIDGEPYVFVGTNFWYGAYLGADAAYGDRERLVRELDRLAAIGVTNLRIAAASEESDFALPLSPPFQYENGTTNETLLQGLDFLLAEMGKRDMRAVLFLNNYWDWTGGMGQYVSWTTGEPVVDPSANTGQTWDDAIAFSARFYELEQAQALYRAYIEHVVTRTNVYTGQPYRDDPTIMTWELANEPRPSKVGDPDLSVASFSRWVDRTAAYIDSLDANHLITTGSEGSKGTINSLEYALQAHQSDHIDYMTFHLWPKNWGWYKADDPATMARTLQNTTDYISEHLEIAARLGKPAVLEEVGFVRDGEAYAPGSPVVARDSFYTFVLDLMQNAAQEGRPMAGLNVWGWGGEGRTDRSNSMWQPGDVSYVADPYSEPQGLNSIFDTDTSMLDILARYARRFETMTPD